MQRLSFLVCFVLCFFGPIHSGEASMRLNCFSNPLEDDGMSMNAVKLERICVLGDFTDVDGGPQPCVTHRMTGDVVSFHSWGISVTQSIDTSIVFGGRSSEVKTIHGTPRHHQSFSCLPSGRILADGEISADPNISHYRCIVSINSRNKLKNSTVFSRITNAMFLNGSKEGFSKGLYAVCGLVVPVSNGAAVGSSSAAIIASSRNHRMPIPPLNESSLSQTNAFPTPPITPMNLPTPPAPPRQKSNPKFSITSLLNPADETPNSYFPATTKVLEKIQESPPKQNTNNSSLSDDDLSSDSTASADESLHLLANSAIQTKTCSKVAETTTGLLLETGKEPEHKRIATARSQVLHYTPNSIGLAPHGHGLHRFYISSFMTASSDPVQFKADKESEYAASWIFSTGCKVLLNDPYRVQVLDSTGLLIGDFYLFDKQKFYFHTARDGARALTGFRIQKDQVQILPVFFDRGDRVCFVEHGSIAQSDMVSAMNRWVQAVNESKPTLEPGEHMFCMDLDKDLNHHPEPIRTNAVTYPKVHQYLSTFACPNDAGGNHSLYFGLIPRPLPNQLSDFMGNEVLILGNGRLPMDDKAVFDHSHSLYFSFDRSGIFLKTAYSHQMLAGFSYHGRGQVSVTKIQSPLINIAVRFFPINKQDEANWVRSSDSIHTVTEGKLGLYCIAVGADLANPILDLIDANWRTGSIHRRIAWSSLKNVPDGVFIGCLVFRSTGEFIKLK